MRWLPLVALIACRSEPPAEQPAQQPTAAPSPRPDAPADDASPPADGASPPGSSPPPPGSPAQGTQAPAGHAPVPGTATAPDPGEEDPQAPRYVVGAAAEATSGWDEARFTCCKEPIFTPVVRSFAELTAALAAEDPARISAASTALNQAIATARADQAADEAARKELEKLGTATAALDGADLASARRIVADLSGTVLIFARARSVGDTQTTDGDDFAGAYCADTDKVWLQGSADLAYPYGDSPDKVCGEFR